MELPLWNTILQKKQDPVKEIFDFLRFNPMLQNMKKKEIWEIARLIHKRKYAPGETIFQQGEAGAGLFLIYSGSVEIHAVREGIRLNLANLEQGALFGELSLFSDEPRTATATAKTDTVLFGFFQPDLETLIQTKPRTGNSLLINFARLITKRLIDTNQLLENAYLRGKKKKTEDFS